MKALIVVKSAERNTDNWQKMAACRATLQSLGITYSIRSVEAMSTTFIANLSTTYAFVVIPGHEGGYTGLINDSGLSVPIIALTGLGGLGSWGATPGISATGVSGYMDRDWETNA